MSDKYTFGYYLNNRAFIEHLKQFKNTNSLNDRHQTILSLICHIYYNYKKIDSILINNIEYKYMSDKLILNQNPLIKLKSRQFKNYLSELVNYKFIRIIIRENNKRYISINKDYNRLLKNENWQITPVRYLQKYKPGLWSFIKNEYEPKLNDFSYSINCFNESSLLNGVDEKYNVQSIFDRLTEYLNKCVNNDYSKYRVTK